METSVSLCVRLLQMLIRITSNYNEKGVYRGNAVSSIQQSVVSNETRPKALVSNYTHRPNALRSNNSSTVFTPHPKVEKGKKACWGCGSESHMLSQCPNESRTVNNITVKANANACTQRIRNRVRLMKLLPPIRS